MCLACICVHAHVVSMGAYLHCVCIHTCSSTYHIPAESHLTSSAQRDLAMTLSPSQFPVSCMKATDTWGETLNPGGQ